MSGQINKDSKKLQKTFGRALFSMSLKKSLFRRQGKSCYNTLQWVTLRYKKLQKIVMYTTFNVAQEIFFLKEGKKLLQHVTTSSNALQDVTKTAQSNDWFESCAKVIFFLKEVISSYNVLQQVTMRYKRLQKIGLRTTFNVAQEIFFLNDREKLL